MTGNAGKKECRYYDIVSVKVEDDGERHTINLCQDCYNMSQDEKEPRASGWCEKVARQEDDWLGCTRS